MTDFSITAGESLDTTFGPVTILGAPIDLRAVNTRIRFIAKESKDDEDADAVWDLLFVPNVTENQGISVPIAGSNNNGSILVPASETREFTDAVNLEHELRLVEPSGRETLLDSGRIRISRPVRRTAP